MDIANSFRDNLLVEDHYRMILDGLQVTLLITLFAALLGTLLGELVTLLKGTSIVAGDNVKAWLDDELIFDEMLKPLR